MIQCLKVIFPVLREMEKSVTMNLGYIGVGCILQWGPKGTNLWVEGPKKNQRYVCIMEKGPTRGNNICQQ